MRKGNEKQMDAIMEAWTRQYTSRELELLLTEAGVPVAHVFSIGELVEDPHLAARGMLVDHDVPGVGRTIFPGNPIKLQATPPDPSLRAPLLGEHTEQVLRDVLGYAPERIEAVRAAGS
jgi:crotonobetainyl-CoA:carnitine CoA-transferase CaiB-like acyl-CoA transferase